MTMTMTERAIDQLIEDQYPVFGDVVRCMKKPPEMPEDLAEFNAPISNSRARELARDLFLFGLRVEQIGRQPWIDPEADLPCSDDPDLYFQDWADKEDFEGGEESLDYQYQVRIEELRAAAAKKGCSICPIQLLCLWKAMESDSAHEKKYKAPHSVVLGGWGAGAREKIRTQVDILRRLYERHMSDGEREEYKRLAMALSVTKLGGTT